MIDNIIDLYGVYFMKLMMILSLYKLNSKKIDYKNLSQYFYAFILTITVFPMYQIDEKFIKPILVIIIFVFSCKLIFKQDIKQSILSTAFIYILLFFCELIILIFLAAFVLINKNLTFASLTNFVDQNIIVSCIINIITSVFIFFICCNEKCKKIYINTSKFAKNKKIINAVGLILVILLSLYLTYSVIYLKSNKISTILAFVLLFNLIVYLLIKNLKINNEYQETKEKYNVTLSSLIEYENMIDKYRINNHENKNQLQMIRNMIKQKDKSVEKYIDNLVDNVYMVNEALMMDVSVIPAGGLRATVYSKLVNMDNNRIKHILNVDRGLRKVDFFENNSEVTLKVCNLLSIFLDNAIDEVVNQDDKKINIDIYLVDDYNVCFEISNKFITAFDVDRIYEKKYTTKFNGHGYGLSLAKEIVDNEPLINNNIEINDDIFIQRLNVRI